MAKVAVRQSFHADVEFIAEHARQEDIDEIRAASGNTVFDSLRYGLNHSSHCWTITLGDMPVSMCGCIRSPVYPDCATIWMISTESTKAQPVGFYRAAKDCLEKMQAEYPCLANYVDSRNLDAIQFLESLDFTLEREVEKGGGGVPFHKFYKVRHHV